MEDKEMQSRREFLRYVMIGGIAVPITVSMGLLNTAEAKVFQFAEDPENLTELERLHLPNVSLPPVVEDGSQASIQVQMDHPMDEDHYIRSIQIVNFTDPVTNQGHILFFASQWRGILRYADSPERRRKHSLGSGRMQPARQMGNQQIHQGRGRRLLDRLKFLLGAGQSWTVRLTVFPILISIACPVSASESEQIRILSTNDIHTYMRPIYYRYLDQPRPWGIQSMEGDYVAKAQYEGRVGGMAYVASVINQLRSEKLGKTLLVDSGDTCTARACRYSIRACPW